jgi:hypothetical protein
MPGSRTLRYRALDEVMRGGNVTDTPAWMEADYIILLHI